MRLFIRLIVQMVLAMSSVIVLTALALLGLTLYQFGQETANYDLLTQPDTTSLSRVYDREGTRIGEFFRERRIYTPLAEFPPHVIQAFLSAEDKNFYRHFGIDLLGLVRAGIHNVRSLYTKERLQGASTITQQVAKKFVAAEPRTLTRKLHEAVIALRLEQRHTKDEILDHYLNGIYLGQGSYGVAAAAQDYFGKNLAQLTLSDAAFLAALPKAPNNYHPVTHTKNALARRNWVLSRMVKNGYIVREQALEAQRQALVQRSDASEDLINYNYFVEHVRRLVQAQYGERTYAGGLHIHTTMDARLQRLARLSLLEGLSDYDRRHGYRGAVAHLPSVAQDGNQWVTVLQNVDAPNDMHPWQLAVVLKQHDGGLKLGIVQAGNIPHTGRIAPEHLSWALKNTAGQRRTLAQQFAIGDVLWVKPLAGGDYALRQFPAVNGALVVLDMKQGHILAMSGGISWQASQFNRATQALRQPGSAFKPFVYATALEKGFTPSSRFLDAPFVMTQDESQNFWKPQNYDKDFFGLASLRLGLEASRNLMTIRVANRVGMPMIVRRARSFGIYTNILPVLSTALGSVETSLLRLTNAYGVLGSGGRYREPMSITRITKHRDMVVFDAANVVQAQSQAVFGSLYPVQGPQVVSEQTAYQITSMLEGVVQRGTARRLRALGYPLAGKTGTSNDTRDAWFIGYTPHLVVGCFVGFDTPQSLGDDENGAKVAIPIVERFLKATLPNYPKQAFAVPSGVEFLQVNLQTGKPSREGRQSIREVFKTGTAPSAPVVKDPAAPMDDAKRVAPNFFELY